MAFQFYMQHAADGNLLHIPEMGLELRVTLPSSISGNVMTILETVNAPGFGPPLHRHRETEVFRVLDGRYLYEVDGQRFEAGEGDTVSVPGGAVHAFVNISDVPGRQLVMMIPGMDAYGFFEGLGRVFAQGRPTLEMLNTYGAAWHMEFLGGPIRICR